jgi:hypothetical protein
MWRLPFEGSLKSMSRSQHENRKPFAQNFLKIPARQHRCNKVSHRLLKAVERGVSQIPKDGWRACAIQ